jgi:hypothetical protein
MRRTAAKAASSSVDLGRVVGIMTGDLSADMVTGAR